ncbi:MAG: glycoside hydrolase family protein, partial [Candidatus Acidiferrales bacterium]
GDAASAANEFLKWDFTGGHQSAGLENRRRAERALFVS